MDLPSEAGRTLLSVFDRIYVINLLHRADRRQEMAAQFKRIGLTLDHPNVVLLPASRFSDPGGFPAPAVRGCFMSHLRVHQDILANGVSTALILEDDADFSRHFAQRIGAMAATLQHRDWHMLYGWPPERASGGDAAGDTALQPFDPHTGIRTSHFIGVRGSVSRRLVPYFEAMLTRPLGDPDGGPMHVDGAYSWFRAAHPDMVTLVPGMPLAVQRPSRSDIHASRWFDKVEGLEPVIRTLRRIKRAVRA